MNTPETETFDILIVGGGMVGLAMAARLLSVKQENKALRLALVDAHPPQHKAFSRDSVGNFDSRVSALTVTSRQLFEELQLWQEQIKPAACPYRQMYVWESEGTGHIQFSSHEVEQAELGFIVENSVISGALNSVLAEDRNFRQFRGEQVRYYEYSNGLNILKLANGQLLQTKLLIAADGANSFIRQEAGFSTREWDYGQQAIVASVATEKAHAFTASQCFLPSGPLAFLPLQDHDNTQHYSSIVWSCDQEKAGALLALDDKAFRNHLQAAFESRLGEIEAVGARHSFPLWQRHASDYVRDGMALLGDAAHTIHPLAGQGVNLGLQDVEILSQVIQQAISKGEDFSSHQVLSRYQRQRKGANLSMMLLMESFKRGFGSKDLAIRWLRNTGLSAVDKSAPIKRQLVRKAMRIQ